jgi:predicted amidohydrolase
LIRVALAQISPKLSKSNIGLHVNIIESEIEKSDIVVFPELSLNGYLLMDRVYEDSYSIDELDIFRKLSLNIDIVVGAALKVEHRVFNSSIYFSKGEIAHIHHKNILPNYGMFEEGRFFFTGDSIDKFDTPYGSAMMVVCEDTWSSNVVDKIAKVKPDNLFIIANSPARGFSSDGLEIEKKWNSILTTISIFSGANTIFVNRVGFEDGVGFWGGSMVIGADSKLIAQAKLFQKETLRIELKKGLSSMQKYMLRSS